MENVPNMISTKDLSYLSDMFGWHFVASKKCHHFANEVTNEEIKELFHKICKLHTKHCQQIIQILS